MNERHKTAASVFIIHHSSFIIHHSLCLCLTNYFLRFVICIRGGGGQWRV
jgi:hypothetical protein